MPTPTTALTGIVNTTIVVQSFQVDANGLPSNTPVTWSSSNTAVANAQNISGTNNGLIFCFTVGLATITATMGSVTKTFTLNVITGTVGAGAVLGAEVDQSFQPLTKTQQVKF